MKKKFLNNNIDGLNTEREKLIERNSKIIEQRNLILEDIKFMVKENKSQKRHLDKLYINGNQIANKTRRLCEKLISIKKSIEDERTLPYII